MHASCVIQARVFRKPRRQTKTRSTGCCHPRDVSNLQSGICDQRGGNGGPSLSCKYGVVCAVHCFLFLQISSLLHLHYLLETGHDVFDCFDGLLPFANGAKETHLVDKQLRTLGKNSAQTTRRTPGKLCLDKPTTQSANPEHPGERQANIHFRNTRNNTKYSRLPHKFTDAQNRSFPFLDEVAPL
jgi:hypothetical protein